MKKYTIEQITKGEVAVKNDGTLEQIQELLDLAFPEDGMVLQKNGSIKDSKFFYCNSYSNKHWSWGNTTDLPTQSVGDFLETEWMPEKRTPYDLAMAEALAIILTKAPSPKKQQLFSPEYWMPKKGDEVLVRDYKEDEWTKAIFIDKIEGCLNPYVTVWCDDESDFREGCSFRVATWAEMKRLIPKEEPKIELSLMVNGQETAVSMAKSEWDKLMKLND